MNRTLIEWAKNPDGTPGYTWNPITGCLNGCPYCYARKLAHGRLRERYLANDNLAPTIGDGPTPYNTSRLIDSLDPFYPRFWEERLGEPIEHPTPLKPAKRKGIFTCDMSDLFGIGIPESWTEQVMTTIKLCPYHRFYLLTKQPQNLIKFSPFPDNCWVGVTATNKLMYADALHHLSKIAAGKIYLSFEPLLSWDDCLPKADGGIMLDSQIDWLIIGAQTKPYKPPEISWVTEIVEAADKADIPIFLKNNLSPLISGCLECVGACSKQFKIENLLLDEEYKLRQELPAR